MSNAYLHLKMIICLGVNLNNYDTIFKIIFIFMFLEDAARSGDKYETSSTNVGYSKFMKLKIRNVTSSDYGSYRCVAKNSLGETDGLIKLEGEYYKNKK